MKNRAHVLIEQVSGWLQALLRLAGGVRPIDFSNSGSGSRGLGSYEHRVLYVYTYPKWEVLNKPRQKPSTSRCSALWRLPRKRPWFLSNLGPTAPTNE